jgi:hypothetical protein
VDHLLGRPQHARIPLIRVGDDITIELRDRLRRYGRVTEVYSNYYGEPLVIVLETKPGETLRIPWTAIQWWTVKTQAEPAR